MEWLDFSHYENIDSKFTAELSEKGGYVTFSNSGQRGIKKYFTLSLESFKICLEDILANLSSFKGHEDYVEGEWRDLGSEYYTDDAANAQSTVQTKPMFTTLSKIIMWANSPNYDSNDPEKSIILTENGIKEAIKKLSILSNEFSPKSNNITESTIENNIIGTTSSIRDFALYVFNHFYGSKWAEVLSETDTKPSKINKTNYVLHNFETFKRLIGEFDSEQTKESLTSSTTARYFVEPILIDNDKFYYFTTQWNAKAKNSRSFTNLKSYFEAEFPNYLLKAKEGTYSLIKIEEIEDIIFDKGTLIENLKESGLIYNSKLVSRFISSLVTKPFVILTGLSGSGKTKLAQAFSQWLCQDESQYSIIPVGADWTNREPLLGYPNALEAKEYIKPDNNALDLIMQANNHPELPYFLILDEMNLSHVERYFADFLSVMESKEGILLYDEGTERKGVPSKLEIPSNLFIIGTVNIDETTNMFSPKVLDRANTIEFRVTADEMKGFLGNIKEIKMENLNTKGAGMAKSFLKTSANKSFATKDLEEINNTLLQFFGELKKTGAEFGYRSATEILRLLHQLTVLDNTLSTNEKIDIAIMQKLLPKLHGSRRKLCPVLTTLGTFCIDGEVNIEKEVFEKEDFDFKEDTVLYPLSLEKIKRMYKGAIDNGFASFAEA